jgi:hypothetical protein
MKGALWMGRLSEEVQCGGLFAGDHERYVKKIYQERRKNALYAGISFHRGPAGEPGGDSLAGIYEKKG